MVLFCTKLHKVTRQKWPAIESEWRRLKAGASVQEHVVLANISVCVWMHVYCILHVYTSEDDCRRLLSRPHSGRTYRIPIA